MLTKDKMFVYIRDLDVWVSLILVLAHKSMSKMSFIDSRGNVKTRPFITIGYGGVVILPTKISISKNKNEKQVFEGIEAFSEKLKSLFPEMRITSEQLEKEIKEAINQGRFEETSVSNMVKVYVYPSCYEAGKLKPNKDDKLIFKAKPRIDFPEYPENPIPLG